MSTLNHNQASNLFVLLMEYGTSPDQFDEFMDYFMHSDPSGSREYRCLPCLGFGGKLYWDGRKLRAGCYPEDYKRVKNKVVEINERLAAFQVYQKLSTGA
jgi:hypothetical protein